MATDTVTALRRKFMIVAIAALVAALLLIFAALNIWNHILATERVDSVISVLYENDGVFPEEWKLKDPRYKRGTFEATSETPFETRYLAATFDTTRSLTSLDATHVAELDEQEAAEVIGHMLDGVANAGYYDRYRFRVFTEQDGSGMIIAVDCFQQLQSSHTLLLISAAIMGATVIITGLFIVPLSKRFVDPYVRNLEQQKRFVTDASHELKTPIAIISANTDLIEATEGESSWTRSTRAQTARLNKLTGELIELARTDEPIERALREDVDFASIVRREVEDFLPLAEASGKTLACTIDTFEGAATRASVADGLEGISAREVDKAEPRIIVSGSPEELDRLVSVLVDNAVKYCDDNGSIRVRLEQRKREIVLTVTNPCASLTTQDTRRIFDRFYRADASRSRSTGGNGIGLSIAQGIVSRHEGSIRARKLGSELEMRVTLPNG